MARRDAMISGGAAADCLTSAPMCETFPGPGGVPIRISYLEPGTGIQAGRTRVLLCTQLLQ